MVYPHFVLLQTPHSTTPCIIRLTLLITWNFHPSYFAPCLLHLFNAFASSCSVLVLLSFQSTSLLALVWQLGVTLQPLPSIKRMLVYLAPYAQHSNEKYNKDFFHFMDILTNSSDSIIVEKNWLNEGEEKLKFGMWLVIPNSEHQRCSAKLPFSTFLCIHCT